MRKISLALGCLLLAVVCWLLGTRDEQAKRRETPASSGTSSTQSSISSSGSNQEGTHPRSATTRPELKHRPILLGKRVTVLEGTITETGSEGPVKFQNRDGMIISASALRAGEGDEVELVAPVEVTGEKLQGKLSIKEGVMTLTKDGTLKLEGKLEFEGVVSGESPQQQNE